MRHDIRCKRIYAEAADDDGARVLVDRLWPRGKRRDTLALTQWYRDASPSPVLRRQKHRGEIDDDTFAGRYRDEIDRDPDCLLPLMRLARQGRLTLLSAARDLEHSHVPVLRQAVLDALAAEDRDCEDLPASAPCYATYNEQRD